MLIRHILAWLFLATLLAAQPATAGIGFFHKAKGGPGSGASPSPNVIPGIVPANTVFNSITPTQHGNPADSAYNMRGWCRFTDPPLIEVGQSGSNGTRQIGIVCAHAAGDSEVAAGIATNIDHVDVRVDGGNWYTITNQSVNPDAGSITDWNFTVNTQNFADGLHQADFRAVPTVGPDIILEGPLEDSSHYATARMSAAIVSDGTGSAPGNVLTVVGVVQNVNSSNGTASLIDGYSLSGVFVAPNSFIDQTHADNPTYTGTGGTGTYHVRGASQLAGSATFTATISGTTMTVTAVNNGSLEAGSVLFGTGVTAGTTITTRAAGGQTGTYQISPSQTVSTPTTITGSTPMVAGNERSYYFTTDYHNTLGRGAHVLYASKTGNDSWDGTSPTFVSGTIGPKLNPSSAAARITANSTNSGAYGGVVCLVDGGSWTSDAGTGTTPSATLGWLKYQSADQAPCVHPGDTGNAALTFNLSDRTWGGLRVWYNHLTLNGAPNTANSSLATQLVAQNTVTIGNKLLDGRSTNGLLGQGGIACLEAQMSVTAGGCATTLIRNSVITYHNNQAWHNVEVALNTTEIGGGPNFEFTSGTATTGSPVITGVTVPAGYALSDLFNVQTAGDCAAINVGCMGVQGALPAGLSCFPSSGPTAATVIAVNDSLHTITLDQNATCTATGPLMFPGVHGDIVQLAVNFFGADVYWANNAGGATWPGWEQGFFVEQTQFAGIYAGNNHFENSPDSGETNLFMSGGNQDVIMDHNTYAGSNGVRLDTDGTNIHNSSNETMVGDTCLAGVSPSGGMNGRGTVIRRKAAATNACYTTQP